jgi:amino acid adenylation domain-containing protein
MSRDANAADGGRSATEIVFALAQSNPDAIALRCNGAKLSYRHLMSSVDQLAKAIMDAGVGPDVPVGICLDRSFDYVIAMLAASRAGGAFMPLDPGWPAERLRFVLDDARAPVLVTSSAYRSQLADPRWTILSAHEKRQTDRKPRARASVTPSNLAYIIYTSGSTGKPKGVEITFGNLLHLITWHNEAFGVTARDRASCVAGLGFDAAVWEIWPYLAAGACLSLPDDNSRTSPEALREWFIAEKISIAFVPTPLAERMISAPWPANTALRFLLTGGDTLHVPPIAGLPFTLVNNYGPTECTVVATSGIVEPAGDGNARMPSIGRAIAGARIQLLDQQGRPVPAGEMGEIFIGGAGVGRGYRHRPDLTAERFVPDVFAPAHDGAKLYRTGDVGTVLPNGEIAFHGRLDNQVKLRGHRVELDEISATLNRHPRVAQSAVVVSGTGNEMRLVAYIVPKSEMPAAGELRDFLTSRLPEHMQPSTFVGISALPLSASGKIDPTALPHPSAANILADAEYCPPASPVEDELARIVKELLAIDHVGVHDNFFLLGGHSLLGTQLVLRARDTFGAELTLRDLFQAQTVAKLAAKIEQRLVERLEQMSEEEASRLLAS